MFTNLKLENILSVIEEVIFNYRYNYNDENFDNFCTINEIIRKYNKEFHNKFIGNLTVKKGGEFGFINFDSDSVFCHNSVSEKFSEMDKELVIVNYKEGNKGKKAFKIYRFNEADEETKEFLLNELQKLVKEEEEMQRNIENEKAAEEAAKKAAIRNLGIDPDKITVKVLYERYFYGGAYEAEYDFGEEISEDQFKNYLELEGRVTVEKPCYGPYSPETVEIKTKDCIKWSYKWVGEFTD